MTQTQLDGLHLGVYRLFWQSGDSSVAAVGHDAKGLYWFAPSNWISGPSYYWEFVARLELIATQESGDEPAARVACAVVNAFGQVEPCCECGADYPRADLIRGEVVCPVCRGDTPTIIPPAGAAAG